MSSSMKQALAWTRWRRGGGVYASAPGAGAQLYSVNPVRTAGGRSTGRYEVTDFHWHAGRRRPVSGLEEAKALAEAWFAEGPAADEFARLRVAYGDWHAQVPKGSVGVTVVLPGGEFGSALITQEVYHMAQSDEEKRIPVAALMDGFAPEVQTKQVFL